MERIASSSSPHEWLFSFPCSPSSSTPSKVSEWVSEVGRKKKRVLTHSSQMD